MSINLVSPTYIETACLIADLITISGAPGSTPVMTQINGVTVNAALEIQSTLGGLLLPRMTTVQKNALLATPGMQVYDTTVGGVYTYDNTNTWTIPAGTGTVTSVNIITSGTGITFTGGPITGSGSLTSTLDVTLQNITNVVTTGLMVKNGTSILTRSINTADATNITVSNSDGTVGNPTLNLATTGAAPGSYTQADITVDAYGRITNVSSGGGSGGAPSAATYILQTPSAFLPNSQPLSALSSGILFSTTATGVVTIASPGNDYYSPGHPTRIIDDGFANGNFFIGSGAGNLSYVTAQFNTGVGQNSLHAINNGIQNTFIGHDSGLLIQNGNFNTGCGQLSLSSIVNNDSCTALGFNAGAALTTGSGNLFLGAGSCSGIASLVNCTSVGYNTAISTGLTNSGTFGYNTSVTVSNAINIGNACFIGLNKTAPTYALDIGTISGIAAIHYPDSSLPPTPASGVILYSNSGLLNYMASDGVPHALVTSIIATANQTTVSGATGNVTVGLANNAILPGTGGVTLPAGTTGQRAGGSGTIRYNTTTNLAELTNDGSTWSPLSTAASGVDSVTASSPLASSGGNNPNISISSSTGSGAVVLATSPSLVTPILDTPTSGTLTNCTGLPLTSGVTGILPAANGGTGINNGSNTLTLAGSLATVGAFSTTFNFTAPTNVTFPTSGTLSTTTGTVTSITAGTGLSGGTITTTGTIAIANTAVTAASYTVGNFTVNAQGQLTAASSATIINDTHFSAGTDNLIIGFMSQTSLSGVTNCTSVGNFAGVNLASGASDNSLFGIEAGRHITTAINCVAVGAEAQVGNTVQDETVAVGSNALQLLSGGTPGTRTGHIAIGKSAGFSINGGATSTFVGTRAGNSLLSSTDSVILGHLACNNMTGGDTLTFVGANTTSSNNVLTNAGCFGANADIELSNAINLGSGCVVGINQSSPLYNLDIANISNICSERMAIATTTPSVASAGYVTYTYTANTTNTSNLNLTLLTLSTNQAATVEVMIRGATTTLSDFTGGTVIAGVMRAAGNISLVGASNNIIATSTGTFSISVNTGTQAVILNATGIASSTYNWVITVKYIIT